MGWIRDAINKAISWLVDTVLRPIVDWVTDAIQWLIAEVRYWKHKFFEMLAEWLENDWFFLGAIAATIVLAVTWPLAQDHNLVGPALGSRYHEGALGATKEKTGKHHRPAKDHTT